MRCVLPGPSVVACRQALGEVCRRPAPPPRAPNPGRAVVAPYGEMDLSWLLAQPYPFVVLTKGEGPTTTVNLQRNFGRFVGLQSQCRCTWLS